MFAISFAMVILYWDRAERMIWYVLLTLILVVPLILAGLYMMFTGKGDWAVSGYNTAPKKIQDLYKAEELSKISGVMLALFCGLMLIAMIAVIMPNGALICLSLLVGGTVVMMYAVVRINKNKNYLKDPNGPLPQMTKEEEKNIKVIIVVLLAISLTITGVIVGVVLFMGDVDVDLREDSFRVDAPSAKKTVEYSEIDLDPFGEPMAELRYEFDRGSKESGFNSPKINSGKYHNNEFGDYVLATYAKVNAYIVVSYDDGHNIVFNTKTVESTENLYEELMSLLENHNGASLSYQQSTNSQVHVSSS
jgi:hypothetical protein